MAGLWRSEEMQLVQLVIPAEAAHDSVEKLGFVGKMAFKDLNQDKSAFQRTYANQVKRCDEMQRKLRFLLEEMGKADIVEPESKNLALQKAIQDSRVLSGYEKTYDLDELEVTLDELEHDLTDISAAMTKLERSKSELVEFQLVLDRAGSFFDTARRSGASRVVSEGGPGASGSGGDNNMESPLIGGGGNDFTADMTRASYGGGGHGGGGANLRLGFIAGLVQHAKIASFERILFRAMRGNMFLRHQEVGLVMDPAVCEKQNKSVFVIFFSGERSRAKILKICDAFSANRYPLPEDPVKQGSMRAEVHERLREISATVDASSDQKRTLLLRIHHDWDSWMALVKREKMIYHSLNKFNIDVTSKCLVAQGWIPTKARDEILQALKEACLESNAPVNTVFHQVYTNEDPPTYFETNKVISGFQGVVDAYGVARYREMNPTVFTIVTFPFLFAIMFGDVGHGILMMMFALFLVLREKKMAKQRMNDMVEMAFGGRYLILLMSVFSIYTGFLYNEMFSIPMTVFGDTKWHWNNATETYQMAPGASPYAFGVDPIWHGTKTELTFLNSMKMKMSIVLGICQMLLGIGVSLWNFLEKPTGPQSVERDMLSITCEFIPRFLFLTCTFGYLAMLIVIKWFSASKADLYLLMINMFLSPGTSDCGKDCEKSDPLYGLGGLAGFLVFVAFCCVPWMLFPKPLILKKRHEKKLSGQEYGILSGDEEDGSGGLDGHGAGGGGGHGHGEEFDFGEEMVHQMIHTIEFVLGAVSNTASYLRLWALSLAHSQLSAVFYEKCFVAALEIGSWWAIVIGFYIWALATFGVLMIMESLSAFLHALRLHWVEYQNKFYQGDGYEFVPFTFKTITMD